MPKELRVEGVVDAKTGAVVLTIDYGLDQMMRDESAAEISKQLLAKYSESAKTATLGNCVVVIRAETAGSPMVESLYDLWNVVRSGGGRVICANYPADFIDSLTMLGLTDLDGFETAPSKEIALDRLAAGT